MSELGDAVAMRKRATLLLLALTPVTVLAAEGPGANLALGKPYTFSKPTNYRQCSGPSDQIDLTDGKYTEGAPGEFWVQQSTVGWGWLHSRHVSITIDLGRVEPIQGLSYSTAGGWG